jgi:hypothetical protein
MKKSLLFLMAFLSTLVLFSAGNLFAGKTLYDDFSTGHLDGKKWFQRTLVREIVDGQFVSKLGNRSPGMGAEFVPGLFMNSLFINPNFINPHTINSIQCDITIVESKLDSAPNSESYARIGGIFYSTDSTGGGTTGGGKGDVWAELGIGDRGNGGLEIFGIIAEFLDDNYQSWNLTGPITIIGPINNVTYPITYTLKLIYNGNNGFEFWANNSSNSSTGPAYQDLPYAKTKKLETVIKATNGSNNGYISAKFDDVYINNQPTVYDDFSTDLIDPAKWEDKEKVREASNGYLRANIPGDGSTQQVNTTLTEEDAPYIEAKVRIDSDSVLSDGADGIGRLQGYYYNESRGPGSGQDYNLNEKDVFAQIRLRYRSDGTRSADALIHRSDEADESSWTELLNHTFSTPISLDTYYTLSIRFEGKKLIFGCAGETAEYNITTETYPPYGKHRQLKSRVYLDQGETGYIKVRFDDVYIEKKVKFMPSTPLLLLNE